MFKLEQKEYREERFSGEELEGQELKGYLFYKCSFRGAQMKDLLTISCSFVGCSFSFAQMGGSIHRFSQFTGCDFSVRSLKSASVPEPLFPGRTSQAFPFMEETLATVFFWNVLCVPWILVESILPGRI